MKTVTFAILATAAAAFALPGIANAASLVENDDLFGRSKFNIERTLASQGIDASGLEAWGQSIRATVVSPDGTKSTQFFDKETLQPVRSSGLSTSQSVGAGAEPYARGDFGSGNNTIISQ